jgi:large subunit ribosomal protein L35
MPKVKTRRSAAKRFRITSGGGIKGSKAFASHILTKKTRKRKRSLRQSAMLTTADYTRVKAMIQS